MKFNALLKKIGLKDLVFIGLIALLFFMYIFRKPQTRKDDKIEAKIEKLEDHIDSLDGQIVIVNAQDSLLRDSLYTLQTEKTKIDAKIKEVYKSVPRDFAIVNSLDVDHLQVLFATWSYESDQ